MQEEGKVYKVLVGNPEGKRLGTPRNRWKDGIRMDLSETGWGNVGWIHLVQEGATLRDRQQREDIMNLSDVKNMIDNIREYQKWNVMFIRCKTTEYQEHFSTTDLE
jgi:hypothetical protein